MLFKDFRPMCLVTLLALAGAVSAEICLAITCPPSFTSGTTTYQLTNEVPGVVGIPVFCGYDEDPAAAGPGVFDVSCFYDIQGSILTDGSSTICPATVSPPYCIL
ncbi:hypothetical protein NEOLEDRAFT_1129603 [Neolentinus lepideus HHB14362 ss-1]|uniref:Uncharacterized protein n=1 Tax=Neolentinus lepideus HHB14362 ss-1 TaxID=1314782 RepID=A0A165UJA8_9AGAM|nr:hypothetical protein NEOLEDRAFT_1129603 [Neolentinus lepideus HHB14362 ss-1]